MKIEPDCILNSELEYSDVSGASIYKTVCSDHDHRRFYVSGTAIGRKTRWLVPLSLSQD
jgi:hypothetical protein